MPLAMGAGVPRGIIFDVINDPFLLSYAQLFLPPVNVHAGPLSALLFLLLRIFLTMIVPGLLHELAWKVPHERQN